MQKPQRCALITGVGGQDGQLLSRTLLEQTDVNYRIVGTMRKVDPLGPLIGTFPKDRFSLKTIEELDGGFKGLLEQEMPDEIYHLAAPSFVPDSWKHPFANARGVAGPLDEIIDHLRSYRNCSLFYASSSEVYGRTEPSYYDEETAHCPVSPYGLSKSFCQKTLGLLREQEKLRVFSGILFNHESFLRPSHFVTMKICEGISRFLSTGKPVELGNLDSERDWGRATDFVKAFSELVQRGAPGDYVVATGRRVKVRDFVNGVADHCAVSIEWKGSGVNEIGFCKKTGKPVVTVNPSFFRENEPQAPCGNSAKLLSAIGWSPSQSLKLLIDGMFES
jgi:GDPmannose 4,6-dehydratase